MAEALAPGVYHGLSFAEYFALPYINNTALGWLVNESPAYFQAKRSADFIDDETQSRRLGTAAHSATLTPKLFLRDYCIEPDITQYMKPAVPAKPARGKTPAKPAVPEKPYSNPRGCKAYENDVEALEAAGNIVLKQPDWDAALSIAGVMRTHPRIANLLKTMKGTETTLIWERDGILCKCRLDLWGTGWQCDLKTTSYFNGFSPWEITKWGYYRQSAWYRSGMEANGLAPEHVAVPDLKYDDNGEPNRPEDIGFSSFIAAVRTEMPEAALFALDLDAMAAGKLEVDTAWATYLKCRESGEWPARYPNAVLDGRISEKRYDQLFGED